VYGLCHFPKTRYKTIIRNSHLGRQVAPVWPGHAIDTHYYQAHPTFSMTLVKINEALSHVPFRVSKIGTHRANDHAILQCQWTNLASLGQGVKSVGHDFPLSVVCDGSYHFTLICTGPTHNNGRHRFSRHMHSIRVVSKFKIVVMACKRKALERAHASMRLEIPTPK